MIMEGNEMTWNKDGNGMMSRKQEENQTEDILDIPKFSQEL